MTPEQRLASLNVTLPPAPKPVAVYKPLVVVGNLAYVSGHGPLRADKALITGVVGRDLDLEAGKAAARQVGLAILATLRDQLGSLDRVKRLIKVLGMVNTAPDFYEHPKVINGCSELFAEIWGPPSPCYPLPCAMPCRRTGARPRMIPPSGTVPSVLP